jgi:hypothetical protein
VTNYLCDSESMPHLRKNANGANPDPKGRYYDPIVVPSLNQSR